MTTALVQAAHSASHQRGSYLRDKFWRLKARRGAKRAAVAIGRKILGASYHMLTAGTGYRELGDAFLDQIDVRVVAANAVQRLRRLGYTVHLERESGMTEPAL